MLSRQRNAEKFERKQQKLDAGLMSSRFPDVATIVISMDYYYEDSGLSFMQRTVNFFPGSAAYFHMECMKHGCVHGGFDLEPVIRTMLKGHKTSSKGELVCHGDDRTRIDYKIAIQYNIAAQKAPQRRTARQR